MKPLREKEQKVYDYIRNSIEIDGLAPSIRDICTALDISSTATVYNILQRLEEKGYIIMSSKISRSIRLAKTDDNADSDTSRVPLLSKITAGSSTPAVENIDGYVDFPKVMSEGRSNLFALRVIGNDLLSSGIIDGDIVIVESGKFLSGELIVAEKDGAIIISRIEYEGKTGYLKWESAPAGKISVKDVNFLGRIIANYRFY